MSGIWYNYSINNPCDVEASRGVTKPVRRLDTMSVTRIPICGIYRITNLINGKSYIGQSRHCSNRWAQHKHGRRKDHNYYLYNAISKYGIENFIFEVMEECAIDQLDDLERKYIAKYDSLKPHGYNLEIGGFTNKEVTAETKMKMSLSSRLRWSRPLPDEERRNKVLCHQKKVSQFTRDGVYVATFDSLDKAAEATPNAHASGITECCKGKEKTAGGFMWRYASDGDRDISPYHDSRGEGHRIPVSCFTLLDKYVKTYESLKDAAEALNISRSCISLCCSGKRNKAGDFIWRKSV
jgi:hypothetical protein